jgi:hypothetical protein
MVIQKDDFLEICNSLGLILDSENISYIHREVQKLLNFLEKGDL